jgi:CubicO group peptidase (beta-lactamase class C family)
VTAPRSAAPPLADVPLPDTPAGHAVADWLAAVNHGSEGDLRQFYKTRYADSLNPPGAIDERVHFVLRSREDDGERHVRLIEAQSADEITALIVTETTERWLRLHMRFDSAHRAIESSFTPAERPDGVGERGALDDATIAARLDAYVVKLAARELFSGTVMVARGDRAFYSRATGLASRAWNAPNAIDTKLNLASMGKMFTSVAIAQLVQQGKLAYTDTIAKLLPEYPNADARKITVHQLLTHTSGLGDYFNEEYERMSKDRLRAVRDYFPLFVQKPLLFEPGSSWSYSNAGFMVLGAIIEKVSGEDYFTYEQRHVWAPAGMRDTGAFELDHDTPNLAIGYTHVPGDAPGAWTNNLFLHVVKGGPAGGSFSTAPDLVRFSNALLAGKLIDREHLAVVTSKKVDEPVGAYGYGFDVSRVRGHAAFGHNGGFAGISTSLTVIPDLGVTIVVLSNLDPPAADRVESKARDLVTQR